MFNNGMSNDKTINALNKHKIVTGKKLIKVLLWTVIILLAFGLGKCSGQYSRTLRVTEPLILNRGNYVMRIPSVTVTQDGYLSKEDFTTFNGNADDITTLEGRVDDLDESTTTLKGLIDSNISDIADNKTLIDSVIPSSGVVDAKTGTFVNIIVSDSVLIDGDISIATSSTTWIRGDLLFYDGANWVILSTAGINSDGYSLEISTINGIPEWVRKSYACIHFSSITTTSILAASGWQRVQGTYVLDDEVNFTSVGGTITYCGATTKMFLLNVAMSMRSSANNVVIHYTVYKRGAPDIEYEQARKIAVSGDIGAMPLTAMFELSCNDEFTIYMRVDKNTTITQEHTVGTIVQVN